MRKQGGVAWQRIILGSGWNHSFLSRSPPSWLFIENLVINHFEWRRGDTRNEKMYFFLWRTISIFPSWLRLYLRFFFRNNIPHDETKSWCVSVRPMDQLSHRIESRMLATANRHRLFVKWSVKVKSHPRSNFLLYYSVLWNKAVTRRVVRSKVSEYDTTGYVRLIEQKYTLILILQNKIIHAIYTVVLLK